MTSATRSTFPVDAVLTRSELADWLKVPVATTYRLEGIPCRRVGREYRYPVAGVLRWLEGDSTEPLAPAVPERPRSGGAQGRGQVFAMPHRVGGRS